MLKAWRLPGGPLVFHVGNPKLGSDIREIAAAVAATARHRSVLPPGTQTGLQGQEFWRRIPEYHKVLQVNVGYRLSFETVAL